METIELRPAYAWDCDHCGRENFLRGVVPEMSPEEEQALKEEMGIESYDEGKIMLMPQIVQCPHCNSQFQTKHYFESNEDEI